MPSQPAWFHRLDEILSALRSMTFTQLDRLAVEKLFRVRQRRARQIMAGLEGLRVGNAAAVSREALIARSAAPPHRDCAAHRTPDIFVCFRGRTAAPFRRVSFAVSIFQSKNEPEIGPGGKGQAAG